MNNNEIQRIAAMLLADVERLLAEIECVESWRKWPSLDDIANRLFQIANGETCDAERTINAALDALLAEGV
jgi:hypothetical protein